LTRQGNQAQPAGEDEVEARVVYGDNHVDALAVDVVQGQPLYLVDPVQVPVDLAKPHDGQVDQRVEHLAAGLGHGRTTQARHPHPRLQSAKGADEFRCGQVPGVVTGDDEDRR